MKSRLRIFNNLSVRSKLIVINMMVSLTVLILFGSALFLYEIYSARQTMSRELTTLAQLLGNRSTAALAFDDQHLAQENLDALSELPNLVMACTYDMTGIIFAEYKKPSQNNTMCPERYIEPEQGQQGVFGGDYMYQISPISQGDTILGYIYLRSDLKKVIQHMNDYAVAGFVFILLAGILAFLLAHQLQRLISRPLTAITRVASTIEENKDYSLRAPAFGQDELGRLADAFNNMLETIETQNRKIRNSEAHYRRLVESSEAIPWELDLDTWRFTYVGPQAIEQLGYPEQQWYEDNFWSEHIYADDYDEALSYCKQCTERGEDHEFEYRMYTADGRIVWIRDDVTVIKENGTPVRLQGFMFDITQRKRMQDAIKNIASGVSAQTGEAFFQQLVLHLAGFFDANCAFIGLLNKQDSGLVNTIAVCAHGSIVENMEYHLDKTPCANVAGKNICAYPNSVQQHFPDDKLLIEMSAESYIGTPLYGSHGELMGLIVILNDRPMDNIELVTEILQIFAARAAAEMERITADEKVRKLSLAVEQSPSSIIITDVEGKIEYVNSTFTEETGYSAEDAIDKTPSLLKSGKTPRTVYNDLWRTISRGETWSGEIYNKKKTGEYYWEFSTISPIKNANGMTTHFLGIQNDITQRKQMEDELRQHRDKLEELVAARTSELKTINKELESFSYSVSHDLRSPLRAIDGFGMALLEDYEQVLDDEGRVYLQRIRQNTQRMGELIDDLLDLSRMGRARLKYSTLDLSALANEVMSSLQPMESGGIVEFLCNATRAVEADSRLMRIVLENLLGNSVKYSRKTEKTIIEFGEQGNESNVFYVRDNGAGFDMKYADKLFGVFQRLHRDTDFEGTGIGLATVQRIIHRHGGEIWAESEPGKGATFYFKLSE